MQQGFSNHSPRPVERGRTLVTMVTLGKVQDVDAGCFGFVNQSPVGRSASTVFWRDVVVNRLDSSQEYRMWLY